MDQHMGTISKIRELSKSERIIFEKTYGQNLQNISKETLKKHSELYELLTSLPHDDLAFIYKLAFPEGDLDNCDSSFYIDKLFNCFDLDKYLPDNSLKIKKYM